MAYQIEVYIRPEGKDGYTVGWTTPHRIPVGVARYEHPTKQITARQLAEAHRQGMIDGMRVASNVLAGVVPNG